MKKLEAASDNHFPRGRHQVFTDLDLAMFKQQHKTPSGEIDAYLEACSIHIRMCWQRLRFALSELHGAAIVVNARDILRMRNCPGLEHVKLLIARHPDTPAVMLELISAAASTRILERIAEHRHASRHLLTLLACNSASTVRIAVCENPNTAEESIWLLSVDRCEDVRYRLAETPGIPSDVLQALLLDENPYVASRAAKTLKRKERERDGWLLLC